MARVNEVLREVLAEEIELVASSDARLELVTVTASLRPGPPPRDGAARLTAREAQEALDKARARLQAAVARQVRLKRTPQLSFEADPAVVQGDRVEEIIRALHEAPPGHES